MNIRITPSQSKALAIGLLLLLIGLALTALVLPTFLLHRHYDQAIEDYTDKLIRYKRFAEQKSAIQEEIKKLEVINPKKFYLKTNNPALAASEIQDSLRQIIESRQGKLVSVQILPPKEEGKYRRISVAVQANVSTLALQQILYGIESKEPHFFIDTISVRAGQGRLYRPLPGIEPEFGLQMTVHSYTIVNPK